MDTHFKQERGFTLIEIVLAIAVGLIIIAGVTVGYTYAKRAAVTDNQKKDVQSSNANTAAPQEQTTPANPVQATNNGNTSSVPQTQSGVSVAGMSKYTDANFGFSFWYPSSWTVTQKSPGNIDWLKGGTTVKEIDVSGTHNQIIGLTIEEFVSTSSSITELYDPPTPYSGRTRRYYFNQPIHTWMLYEDPGGKSLSSTHDTVGTAEFPTTPPYTTTADVSHNTMGGLHIFPGIGITKVIVPLSANHFLVVIPDGKDEPAFARTILATDSSVATPISDAEQIKTIQAEKDYYSAVENSIPTITSFSQTIATPGDTITVYGTNFSSDTQLDLDGIAPQQTLLSSTKLTFVVPSHYDPSQPKSTSDTSLDIFVRNKNGTAWNKNAPLIVHGF